MFFDFLLFSGLVCGVYAFRTRHADLRFIASYAATAVFVLAILNWSAW